MTRRKRKGAIFWCWSETLAPPTTLLERKDRVKEKKRKEKERMVKKKKRKEKEKKKKKKEGSS